MIGFHTFDYMRHFLSAAYRITGHEHKYGRLTIGMRLFGDFTPACVSFCIRVGGLVS